MTTTPVGLLAYYGDGMEIPCPALRVEGKPVAAKEAFRVTSFLKLSKLSMSLVVSTKIAL
jgi:hypothetical protein